MFRWLPALVAVIAGATYLGLTTLRDKVVHERVAVGPAQAAGTFRSGEHATSGTARVVRIAGGRRVLTLTGFDTSAGPDLRVRIGREHRPTAARPSISGR